MKKAAMVVTEYDRVQETVKFLRRRWPGQPELGVVLGTGLGASLAGLEQAQELPYESIPHFGRSTVAGHRNSLLLGKLAGHWLVALCGRYHTYEGFSLRETVFPVRVLCGLGVTTLLLTNSAGAVNPELNPGQWLVIRDHLNLLSGNPLAGEHDERFGRRFPDLGQAYDPALSELLLRELRELGETAHGGVYAAVNGPSFETPAEARALSGIGADAVGMSTVPEVIAARQMSVRVAGLSYLTNRAGNISAGGTDHLQVVAAADRVSVVLGELLRRVVAFLFSCAEE
jgi:purine-nucleoside phosphorylase